MTVCRLGIIAAASCGKINVARSRSAPPCPPLTTMLHRVPSTRRVCREPRQAMVLIHDQIERTMLLSPAPRHAPRAQGRHATTVDMNAIKGCMRNSSRKRIRAPMRIVPSLSQRAPIRQSHPFSPARSWVLRVPPVEHKEAHPNSAVRSREHRPIQAPTRRQSVPYAWG